MPGAAGAAAPLSQGWSQDGAQDAGVSALPRAGAAPQRYLLISAEPLRLAVLAAALATQQAEVTLMFPSAADRHRVLVLRPDAVLLDVDSAEQRRRVLPFRPPPARSSVRVRRLPHQPRAPLRKERAYWIARVQIGRAHV